LATKKKKPANELAHTKNVDSWRKSIALASICSILFFSNIFSFSAQISSGAHGHIYAVLFFSLASLLVLWRAGPDKPVVSETLYALLAIAGLALTAINNHQLARAGETAKIFEGYKIASILLALLAIQNWRIGVPLILACGLLPVAQFYSWPPEWREVVYGGPFVPSVYATVAMGTYIYINRSRQKLHQLIQSELETVELRRFARVMISAKDLANTPLQILKAGIALSRLDPQNLHSHLDKMERACGKLESLNKIFSKYESSLDWSAAEAMDSEDLIYAETNLLTRKDEA
jgi:hypothetical protein